MPKVKIQGVSLDYQIHGRGVPLVMLQGFGGGHRGWFFQTRAFKKYYQVVTVDDGDWGERNRLPRFLTLRQRSDGIIALMDYLNIEKAHVLSVSRGGMIAQEVAINYPDRVIKLVLGCTAASGREMSEPHPEMMNVLIAKNSPDFDLNRLDFARTIETMISLSFNRALYRNTLLVLMRFATMVMKIRARPEQLEALDALMSYSAVDRLHMIKSPTLVITGDSDRMVPPRCSEILAERIPKAKLVTVQGGSHAFFIEMRGRFNKEVLDFLKSQSPNGRVSV